MGAEQKYFEQIPDYLDGVLSEVDQKAFERQLAQDQALADELKLHREVGGSLADTDLRSFRDKLESFNRATPVDSRPEKPSSRLIPLRTWVGIAAAVALLILVGTWLLSPGPSVQESLTAYWESYDPADILPAVYIGTERSSSVDPDSSVQRSESEQALHEARLQFSSKKYAAALSSMGKIDPAVVSDRNDYFYELAVLYLLNGQAQPALEALDEINSRELGNAKQWYRALGYLQLGRPEEAKPLLQDLAARKNPWQEDAGRFLQNL